MTNLDHLPSLAREEGGDAPIGFLTPAEYEYLESRGLLPPDAERIEYLTKWVEEG